MSTARWLRDHRPARPPRSRLVTALMILAGILMLLPGLCSIFGGVVIATGYHGGARDPLVIALWAVSFATSIAGILLLRRASRG
jgi:UPF0716 family protein affecting phage T7 exclusion